MKKILLLLAALTIWQYWDSIGPLLAQTGGKPSSVQKKEVILYATDWCGYCARTRDFLKQQGITYTEIDIEKSSQGRSAYNALGGRGVPLLKVNGSVIHGYDPQGILAAY